MIPSHRFTVRARIPERLAALETLAWNLRWSWDFPTRELFAELMPGTSARDVDPLRCLGEVTPARWEALAADAGFATRVDAAAAGLAAYLAREDYAGWALADPCHAPRSIAYLSMEVGITEVLPNYSRGLGVLAGDHLKTASDMAVPLIGVSLAYRSGYFVQSLGADGLQRESYPSLDPASLPLELLRENAGAPVLIYLSLPAGEVLAARVWIAQVGRVPLLLLDTDTPENSPSLRAVTDRLYGGDQDHRIRQEILAGIGGVRAVRAFCELRGLGQPEVFHTNEGHAGFQGLERIRELVVGYGLDFDTALAAVRAGTVFTTHTPVAAGIDRFPAHLVRHYFAGQGSAEPLLPGVDLERILDLGDEGDPLVFNMAHMGLRLAQRANGVSQLHGAVSRGMFSSLWPAFDPADVPIGSITNGVHAASWVAPEWLDLASGLLEDPAGVSDADRLAALGQASPEQLWQVRGILRTVLVAEVRHRVRASWRQRGASDAQLGWTDAIFDPDVLTIGFARRVPTYKRLTLMLRDPGRLRGLLTDPERPVQLVVAGKAHPADGEGKELIAQIVRFADDPEVRNSIAFLPDYDMTMARYLYLGCDVWLNNPLRPLEACGTSGMKSALNGGLNLSVRDGWWDEFYDGSSGWAIATAEGVGDPERRDDVEAGAMYELLERTIAPLFYERDDAGLPAGWLHMVAAALKNLGPQVLSERMLTEYVRDRYLPAAGAARSLGSEHFAGARELAAFRGRVTAAWPGVRGVSVVASGHSRVPIAGDTVDLEVVVSMAGLGPEDVAVQAIVGPVTDSGEVAVGDITELVSLGEAGSDVRWAGSLVLRRAGSVGLAVRAVPRHRLLGEASEWGLVAWM